MASVNYRFTSTDPVPAPVYDAARAVQFLRTKAAEWQLDPRRFATCGVSAGGTTTLWLACHDDLAQPDSSDPVMRQSSRVQAAVAFSPPTSLDPEVAEKWIGEQVLRHPMIVRAVGATEISEIKPPRPDWLNLLREMSPINHISADDPPILLSFPRIDPLPATTPGSAIHHALFGAKFQEKATAAGATCILRIQDRTAVPTPTPEEFLMDHLTR